MVKKVLITGVAGFIGSHLAERFAGEGYRIVGVDNLSRRGSIINLNYLADRIGGQLDFMHADVRDSRRLDEIIGSVGQLEGVIHEAAQVAVTTSVTNPRHDLEVNIIGTFNLLDAVRRLCPDTAVLSLLSETTRERATRVVNMGLKPLELSSES